MLCFAPKSKEGFLSWKIIFASLHPRHFVIVLELSKSECHGKTSQTFHTLQRFLSRKTAAVLKSFRGIFTAQIGGKLCGQKNKSSPGGRQSCTTAAAVPPRCKRVSCVKISDKKMCDFHACELGVRLIHTSFLPREAFSSVCTIHQARTGQNSGCLRWRPIVHTNKRRVRHEPNRVCNLFRFFMSRVLQ